MFVAQSRGAFRPVTTMTSVRRFGTREFSAAAARFNRVILSRLPAAKPALSSALPHVLLQLDVRPYRLDSIVLEPFTSLRIRSPHNKMLDVDPGDNANIHSVASQHAHSNGDRRDRHRLLDFQLTSQFYHAVCRQLEKLHSTLSIAQHPGEQLLPPNGHPRPTSGPTAVASITSGRRSISGAR